MRRAALALTLMFAAAPLTVEAASAPPVADVRVEIGGELARKADEYGPRELDRLKGDLRADVEQALRRKGRLARDGVRLEVTVTDAVPNRPTFAQMGRRPDLSMRSFGVGGATIEAREITADGHSRALSFRWYESDIRNARGASTWSDAERAFELFARAYADGKL